MVNFEKVSEAVQKLVASIAQTEGDKKKIDTQNEYNKLGEYLNGNANKLSTQDKEYIEGFMIDYQENRLSEEIANSTGTNSQEIKKELLPKERKIMQKELKILAKRNKMRCRPELQATDLQTIEYKTKAGDTWLSIVKEHYSEQVKKYGEVAAVHALKKNLSVDENGNFDKTLYNNLLKAADLPKTLKLPMFITFD